MNRLPRHLVVLFLLIGLFAPPALQAECADYEQHARWIGGLRNETDYSIIDRVGDLVYQFRYTWQIYDASDPVRPVLVAELPVFPGLIRTVDREGDILAVGSWEGWALFDISDPRQPELFWQGVEPSSGQVDIVGDRLYMSAEGRIEIHSLAIGEAPQLLGFVEVDIPQVFTVAGDLLFHEQDSGVQCFDVTDPAVVVPLGFAATHLGFATRTMVSHLDRIFATSIMNQSGGYLSVIDYSDPDHLIVTTTEELHAGWIADLAFVGDLAVVTSGNHHPSGFVVLDVTNPDQPQWLGWCKTVYAPFSIASHGPDQITLSLRQGFGVFDISHLAFLDRVADPWTNADMFGLVVREDYLYAATEAGLTIWDVSDPLHPEAVTAPLWGEDLRVATISGDELFLGAATSQIFCADLSEPLDPYLQDQYIAPGQPEALAVDEDWLVAACGQEGVAVFDRGGGWYQDHVTLVGRGEFVADARDVALADGIVVVGDWVRGVTVFAIGPDGALECRAQHPSLAPVTAVTVVAGYIYAAGGGEFYDDPEAGSQLTTIALSETGHTAVIDRQEIPVGAGDLELDGDVLYLGLPAFGTFAYSLADSPIPRLLGGVGTRYPVSNYRVFDICVDRGHVYAATGYYSLQVLPAHCVDTPLAADDHATPAVMALVTAAPNPFNPRTVIAYDVAVAGTVSLQIVDLRGRLVATLVDQPLEAGRHRVEWDGRDPAGRALPSGVYIARLVAGEQLAHGRLTLVR